jgi:hypothetical protein
VQAASWLRERPPGRAFVPRVPPALGFDAVILRFRCVGSGSLTFVFPSLTSPCW